MSSSLDVFKDFFCGCVSGWAQFFTMFLSGNYKLKAVLKPEELNQGYIHAFKKTIAEEGTISFYKSLLMPLLGVGAQVSLQFGTVETLKKFLQSRYG